MINLGRDNDTTAAVLGGVLGAYWGADHLPAHLVDPVIKVNKELLDNDLEQLANQLTDKIYRLYNH